MTNELTWLARHIHAFEGGKNFVQVSGDVYFYREKPLTGVSFSREEWLARRAELEGCVGVLPTAGSGPAGTGAGGASESAFLVGQVIDLLRTSADHFSADELSDLNELTGAELTKRDS